VIAYDVRVKRQGRQIVQLFLQQLLLVVAIVSEVLDAVDLVVVFAASFVALVFSFSEMRCKSESDCMCECCGACNSVSA